MTRQPESEAEGRRWYDLHRVAQKNGGPCEVCGWRDGDGAKLCFYSSELGEVLHSNTMRAAMESMTPEQASLVNLRSALLYINADLRERHIQQVAWHHRRKEALWIAQYPDRPYTTRPDGTPWPADEWIAEYRAKQERNPLATDDPYSGWIHEHWWLSIDSATYVDTPIALRGVLSEEGQFMAYQTHCNEPHPGCGGKKVGVGPYHLRCSRCGVEVRLWEHGIDYDIG